MPQGQKILGTDFWLMLKSSLILVYQNNVFLYLTRKLLVWRELSMDGYQPWKQNWPTRNKWRQCWLKGNQQNLYQTIAIQITNIFYSVHVLFFVKASAYQEWWLCFRATQLEPKTFEWRVDILSCPFNGYSPLQLNDQEKMSTTEGIATRYCQNVLKNLVGSYKKMKRNVKFHFHARTATSIGRGSVNQQRLAILSLPRKRSKPGPRVNRWR